MEDIDRLQINENRDKIDSIEVLMDKDRKKRYEDRVVTALLRTKLEDMEFHNFINDVFRFMRDGIIAKTLRQIFPIAFMQSLY